MGDLGLYLIPALFMLCFGGLTFALMRAFEEGLQNYSGVYAQDAARQFEDLFLFIPAKRIAEIAQISAFAIFVLFFLLFGGFSSQGVLLRGLILGGFGAIAALNAPRITLRILRKRRLTRFNNQLVDSLIGMSSALKAGFSILQAFESIVKQGDVPIAQEFGLFLQQIRVGVKFEDSLRQMEDRVGSEDLTLMNQSIEIARQTGGNLTEVFEKIAATIRERMRIEQRIRTLTAQGRLQGFVVGSVPILLMLAMTWLDPKMMIPFFTSKIGIGMIIVAGLLELCGALIIKKIIDIKV